MKPVLFFLILCSSNVYAEMQGDPEKGKMKSPSCVYCHGITGEAVNSSYPNLHTQNARYLFLSMKAYQNGERTGPLAQMMAAQLQRLNDQDLKDIAAFYAKPSNSENN